MQLQIFLIDDDDDDVLLFSEAFKEIQKDGQITRFENGLAFCSHLGETHTLPNLIFLDINMPLMNGVQCVKEIRADKKFDTIPIIMYSTSNRPEDITETFKNGANLYLRKPTTFNELKVMIQGALRLFNENKLFEISRRDFVVE